MKTYTIMLTRSIQADSKEQAIREFWQFVDDAETHDLNITEEED